MGKNKNVAIVGAGVGGLSCASRLAHDGFNVSVFEKLSECGGRAHIIEDKGFRFDTGPSFVLMPDFFNEVFTYCGQKLNDYLKLKVLDVHYKIFYSDSRKLTVFFDPKKTKQELEKFERNSGEKYDRFIRETAGIFDSVKPLLYRCFTKGNLFNPKYFGLLSKLRVNNTYWGLAKKFFNSDELCYAFTFEAMFIGVSPFSSPAFYSVITYADHVQKIFHPMGGMYEIPKALEAMSKKFNARFNYDISVTKITKTKDKFVLKTRKGDFDADNVVVNADYSYAREELLGQKIPDYQYSCSVFLIYLGLKQKVKGLEHHNLFFAKDLRGNLDGIFKTNEISKDFSFYIHVPTVTDGSLAPQGKEILYILIPIPNLKKSGSNFKDYEEILREIVLDRINKEFGINVEPLIEVEHRFHPEDFTKRYNIKFAATFGLAHSFFQSAFFRPYNFDSKIKGLYFVGASTQPGGGLPPVIASSSIVAGLIKNNT